MKNVYNSTSKYGIYSLPKTVSIWNLVSVIKSQLAIKKVSASVTFQS